MTVATIINFCTNERRFLEENLQQALKFSSQVIVPIASHLFDGTLEDQKILWQIYEAFPSCQFLEYPFLGDRLPKHLFYGISPKRFWHGVSRYLAAFEVDPNISAILFLDADEIVDADRWILWWQTEGLKHNRAMKLANYWYFRAPHYRAKVWEDSPVIIRTKYLKKGWLLHEEERSFLYETVRGPKQRCVLGLDGKPMVHHFSWVRTEQEMHQKVASWGHQGEKNWKDAVTREFAHAFQGKDFVHGYEFDTVEPPFGIMEPSYSPSGDPRVKILSTRELLQKLSLKLPPFVRWLKNLAFRR